MSMQPSLKACPIVLRERDTGTEILSFEHPNQDFQLVKGTIEPGESHDLAALRELEEESGISDAHIVRFLQKVHFTEEQQSWSVYLCKTGELPENWSHMALEGDGEEHEFRFFWHRLDDDLGDEWHYTFQHIIELVRTSL